MARKIIKVYMDKENREQNITIITEEFNEFQECCMISPKAIQAPEVITTKYVNTANNNLNLLYLMFEWDGYYATTTNGLNECLKGSEEYFIKSCNKRLTGARIVEVENGYANKEKRKIPYSQYEKMYEKLGLKGIEFYVDRQDHECYYSHYDNGSPSNSNWITVSDSEDKEESILNNFLIKVFTILHFGYGSDEIARRHINWQKK